MIGQSLVFVCATFALVAGSCIQAPIAQGLVSSCGSPIGMSSVGCNGVGVMSSGLGLASGAGLVSGAGLASGVGLGLPITDGPHGTPITVAQAPSVTLPAVETPVVPLPSQPIFAPRVISQRCICTKTMVKPQIYQRLVTVPKIQRYLKRTVSPIVENVSFKATPVSRAGVAVAAAPAVGVAAAPAVGVAAAPAIGVAAAPAVTVASAPAMAVASGSACASPVAISRPAVRCI